MIIFFVISITNLALQCYLVQVSILNSQFSVEPFSQQLLCCATRTQFATYFMAHADTVNSIRLNQKEKEKF